MPEQIDVLREILGTRYAVDCEIGRGGMATVYRAQDLVSQRVVAVKMLLPDLTVALGEERFRREIEIEQQLDHPNILSILDWGEANGRLYYVMPFVAGESLAGRLEREGALPVEEALRLGIAVARALHYAHGRNIIHRDVKPENILLEGEQVLVADFGIARALSQDQAQKLTQTGVTLGTPVYMSPEQSLGEQRLDGRSDMYALACVIYEMLAGQPPFGGPNSQAIMARHLMEEVPSLTVVRPVVSDALEDILLRALAKTAADRWKSMGEFADALEQCLTSGRATATRTVATPRHTRMLETPRARRRRLLTRVAAVVVLLASGVGIWQLRGAPSAGLAADLATKQVAVLYLADRSRDGSLSYLADAVTETMIEALEGADLNVVSRAGVLPFRGEAVPPDSIAAQLSAVGGEVGLLVDGSVEKRNGRARVTLSLLQPNGAPIESNSFDFPLDSAVAAGESLEPYMAKVESFLRRQIGEQVAFSRQRSTAGNDAAWLALQRASAERKRTEQAWRTGDTTATLEALVATDSMARAAAALAPTWVDPVVLRAELASWRAMGPLRRRPDDAQRWLDSARTFASRALELEGGNAGALEVLGQTLFDRVSLGLVRDSAGIATNVDSAATLLRAAVERDRARASAWVTLSRVAYRQLNVVEANSAARTAYAADAFLTAAPDVLFRLFATSYDLGQAEDARRWCETGRQRFPENPNFTRCGLFLMTMRGAPVDVARADSLRTALETLWSAPVRPYQTRYDRMLYGAVLGQDGRADSARRVLAGARADRTIDPQGELRGLEAFARLRIGDREEALTLLEQYLRDNPAHLPGFRRLNTWWWQDIQQEPRFLRLVGSSS